MAHGLNGFYFQFQSLSKRTCRRLIANGITMVQCWPCVASKCTALIKTRIKCFSTHHLAWYVNRIRSTIVLLFHTHFKKMEEIFSVWSNKTIVYLQRLRSLKVPGHEITAMAWEGNSLRIALAVDSFIYFANIRPDYMWCYFGKTVCYLNTDRSKSGTFSITFWDTVANQCNQKTVDEPVAMVSCGDHCAIAVTATNGKEANAAADKNDKRYQLLICNSIGTTVDCKCFRIEYLFNVSKRLRKKYSFSLHFPAKYIDLSIQYMAMNSQFVIVASTNHFVLWQYHTPKVCSFQISYKFSNRSKY